MGSPQNPSATPTFPATIIPPINGDNLSATDLNVNVETPLQNGVEAARLLTYGGGIRRRVYCSSNTVMVIQPSGAVIAKVAGAWTVVPWTTGAATINPTALSGGLVANTRYWVYATAVLSTGIPVFVVSTNAPDAALKYSSATTDQMYVSTFITDVAGDIVLYKQADSIYAYSGLSSTGLGVNGNLLIDGGHATVATTVASGLAVPSGYSKFNFIYYVSRAATGFSGSAGDVGAGIYKVVLYGDGTITTHVVGAGETTGAGVDYFGDNAATTSYIWVTGFTL